MARTYWLEGHQRVSANNTLHALHLDAGAGFGDVSDRGLTAKGAAPVAAFFIRFALLGTPQWRATCPAVAANM